MSEVTFLICAGNVTSGFTFFGDAKGEAFLDRAAAEAAADRFLDEFGECYSVIEVNPLPVNTGRPEDFEEEWDEVEGEAFKENGETTNGEKMV